MSAQTPDAQTPEMLWQPSRERIVMRQVDEAIRPDAQRGVQGDQTS